MLTRRDGETEGAPKRRGIQMEVGEFRSENIKHRVEFDMNLQVTMGDAVSRGEPEIPRDDPRRKSVSGKGSCLDQAGADLDGSESGAEGSSRRKETTPDTNDESDSDASLTRGSLKTH